MEQMYENHDYIEEPQDPGVLEVVERLGGIAAWAEGEAVTTTPQVREASDDPVAATKRGAKVKTRDTRSAWEVLQREPDTGFGGPLMLRVPDPLYPDTTNWINLDEPEEDPQE
jgi:hypothetical protein